MSSTEIRGTHSNGGPSVGNADMKLDPDGSEGLLQAITSRLPGRVDPAPMTFASTGARAGEHEKRVGEADACWPDWYAGYVLAEAGGTELPT
jgi:hypothetical protein